MSVAIPPHCLFSHPSKPLDVQNPFLIITNKMYRVVFLTVPTQKFLSIRKNQSIQTVPMGTVLKCLSLVTLQLSATSQDVSKKTELCELDQVHLACRTLDWSLSS